MAHKTLINGTSYDVSGGKAMLGGTVYDIASGKALITNIGYEIPFSKGIPLSSVGLLSKVMLNENGSPVEFYVCKHDYESELNGAGRTLLVREECYSQKYSTGEMAGNNFSGSTVDTWLNGDWLNSLDAAVRAKIGKTKFYYTPGSEDGSGTGNVKTLERAAFLLSATEFGQSYSGANTEGTALDSTVTNVIKRGKVDGRRVDQWTRSPYLTSSTSYIVALSPGGIPKRGYMGDNYGARPAFTLPGTFPLVQNADGTYSQAA